MQCEYHSALDSLLHKETKLKWFLLANFHYSLQQNLKTSDTRQNSDSGNIIKVKNLLGCMTFTHLYLLNTLVKLVEIIVKKRIVRVVLL